MYFSQLIQVKGIPDVLPTQNNYRIRLGSPILIALASLLPVISFLGCASSSAQRQIESVAKEWCQTIRASQVIPVYPLTDDLRVGDVFLVQTPVSTQEKIYKKRGFMSLDDQRTRLNYTNFSLFYFSGYWRDEFGKKAPHPREHFTDSGSWDTNKVLTKTLPSAPRVAFPTYSFQAKSGYGLSAALPIHDVPVALTFLGDRNVNGSVSISDASTYSGDRSELMRLVKEWAAKSNIVSDLTDAARISAPTPVYLRVITRIYTARAMQVVLSSTKSKGGRVAAGKAPEVNLVNSDGSLNEHYDKILEALNKKVTLSKLPSDAGGAAAIVSVSGSSVGISQSFDTPLVIGYLGMDLPVYENGTTGTPIPTFQILSGGVSKWLSSSLEAWSFMNQLSRMIEDNPVRAVEIMKEIVRKLKSSDFMFVKDSLESVDSSSVEEVIAVNKEFRLAARKYVKVFSLFRWRVPIPQRLNQLNAEFERAYLATDTVKTANQ